MPFVRNNMFNNKSGSFSATLTILALLCQLFTVGTAWTAGRTPLRVGDVPPKAVLSDLNGDAIRVIDDFKGKVIILHFWSGGCSSCRLEMPAMEKLYKQYGRKGLVILAVNVGQKKDVVKKWVKDLGISYPVLLDTDKKMADKYDVVDVPRTYLIERKGLIRYKILGTAPEEVIKKQVLSLL
jgi:peroxiredoxin